jgi:hypothetical protein
MIAQRPDPHQGGFRAFFRPGCLQLPRRNSGAAGDKTALPTNKSIIYFKSSYLTLAQ